MNQGISESIKAETSQASLTSGASSQLSSSQASFSPGEKLGALGRHSVSPQQVSTGELIGIGALGGLVGATLGYVVKSANRCPWTTVAATSAVGATVFALGTAMDARSVTPLEHAEAELMQTQDDKECLLKRDIDNPVREYDKKEIYTIKRLSERYGESWLTFRLLWEVLYTERFQSDYEDFLDEFFSQLMNLHVGRREINDIVTAMKATDSLEVARELPAFQKLTERSYILSTTHDEIARLMFTYSRLLLANDNVNDHRGAKAYELYQTLCLEKYESLKIRIALDESRLIEDIRILRAMAEEKSSLSNS
ncbi:hypothetical protein [Endozoicomonas sp. SESOKO1]|uniref:hypothetical protein n=1 Tax=Endozoicomonas sp. SESOKO1 TaxID=2828742 RepID=UPI0021498057|nr:hypothetical protein [Endozoicomonas sp. SESOKO1]